jgi:hypothetical protein
MRNRSVTVLLWSSAVVLGAACGASNATTDRAESTGPDASREGPPADAAVVDESTAADDASSGAEASSDVGSRVGPDGSAPIVDAAADGGLLPFKGVANSACTDLGRLGVSWWYNWSASRSGCDASQFVPMIWGQGTSANIAKQIASLVSQGFTSVLGFNEPDNSGQSNISVATAISLWPSFNDPALRLGSPATQGNGTGLTWIQNFMSQVDADTSGKLRVDFIATHWYGWNSGSCDAKAANLESWLKQIEAIPGNRPIWLTEWGCLNASNPDAATVKAFYSGALVMFARHPRLERYAWYPWTKYNELVDADAGTLTTLGTAFAAAPATR